MFIMRCGYLYGKTGKGLNKWGADQDSVGTKNMDKMM